MIGNSGLHRWCNAQGLVNPAEIVVHEIQGDCRLVVFQLLCMSPGTATKGGGDRIANFLNTKSLNPFVSNTLREMIIEPIKFRAQGSMAYG